MAKKYYRILSIDGGGIRGIVPGQFLVSLEQKLKARTKNENARIADYFDLIAGTSTGGILACLLLKPSDDDKSRPAFSAEEVVGLYFERGGDIFSTSFKHKLKTLGGVLDEKYPSEGIETSLQDYFGDTKLSDLLKPSLITSYDIKRRKGHFFRQHKAVLDPAYDYLAHEVARSTSAAPTYFEVNLATSLSEIDYPLIDGGVFVNNPSLCAYSEARVHAREALGHDIAAKDMAVLSVGTGFTRKVYEYDKAKDWGMAQWIKPLIDIMMGGVSDTVDFQLGQIFDAAGVPDNYVRINTELPTDINPEMDDASEENMKALKQLGTEMAQNNEADVDRLIDMLLAEES